ncbi:PAS domain-containing protein [Streptomyces sp. TS71-3]|uniref:PAS domain-containing protein n=1 Tax=Streptomyces sp. TS71-3 TaxID=2733862 RepID=UPI001B2CD1E2|nr:PAS domain-containing protein [Streptomyces sp. TS71-3]GHJ40157.1 hypothetical protein Sm713_57660 [Streptomyces sp. TS71-3]
MSSRPSRGAARLAAILDALPDALVLVNANGTIVNANTMALDFLEAPGTRLVGRGLLDLLPHFDSALIPGSMRRPDSIDDSGRTKPTRMLARRTDGNEIAVEVTSANLERGQTAYETHGYTGDELLMLVVRDLSGTLDTEAELARSQRQTEMILRAAAEGVVGTDTDGRVVLVNPAAAQILGYRASDLGGKELHTLVLHSRADGAPFPYGESPLADTLRSGRKHRVRGQVLWSKKGEQVAVDLTTAPVRDGDQLVGAVLTFTDRRPYDTLAAEKEEEETRHRDELARVREEHAAELAELRERHEAELAGLREEHAEAYEATVEAHEEELAVEKDRYAALAEREKDRYEALDERHEQLLAVLGGSLSGPLDELRGELYTLAQDDGGQLWPEANQVLHHLAAGYSRITTLVSNVLHYQRLDAGTDQLYKRPVLIDGVVAAGVDGAVELIGPGRAQFAVHAPPLEASVDPDRLATALAHLVADVAGVDATGNAPVTSGGYMDSTIVVAAAQRGDVVRIEVRGPYPGGDLVHEPIVRGIVRAHGGVLQTHEVPGMSGTAYVLEVPIGGSGAPSGFGAVAPGGSAGMPGAQYPGAGAALGDPSHGAGAPYGGDPSAYAGASAYAGDTAGYPDAAPAGGALALPPAAPAPAQEEPGAALALPQQATGGRRRARRSSVDSFLESGTSGTSGSSGSSGPGGGADDATGPEGPQGEEAPAGDGTGGSGAPATGGTGRRRGRRAEERQESAQPASTAPTPSGGTGRRRGRPAEGAVSTASEHAPGSAALGAAVPPQGVPQDAPAPKGRRARRASSEQQGESAQPARPALPAPALPAGPSAGAAGPAQTPPGAPVQVPPGGTLPPGSPVPLTKPSGPPAGGGAPGAGGTEGGASAHAAAGSAAGRRGRRALTPAGDRAPAEVAPPRAMFALPPAEADRTDTDASAGHAAALRNPSEDHTPLEPHPLEPTGRRRTGGGRPGHQPDPRVDPRVGSAPPGSGRSRHSTGAGATGAPAHPAAQSWPGAATGDTGAPEPPPPAPSGQRARPALPAGPTAAPPGAPLPPERGGRRPAARGPAQGGAPDPDASQGRSISVRTLGQGVPFARQVGERAGGGGQSGPPSGPSVSPLGAVPSRQTPAPGATPPGQPGAQPPGATGQSPATQAPGSAGQSQAAAKRRKLGNRDTEGGQGGQPSLGSGRPGSQTPPPPAAHTRLASASEGAGRSYAIGAPDEDADEGPEPLDGPGGAVEVSDQPAPQPLDDELPPEPLDNPRRLLVWPAPDVYTEQALSDRGYRPVIVHSREEVDAQIAAFPAALFVDPLTGPITRTALQSLRQAAVAAEVPVLVTAGLGQATRDAAYGADPAVLLKALAPRDSEQHPPRVLLIEEHAEIAVALTAALERRGLQVACATSDDDGVALAAQMRPNLVVMDLMQVRRRRAGIIDWLRANGQLNRTPLVVYTAAVDQADLPRLAAGETVLFLAERSTSGEVQARIVDLLAKIGTN